MDPFDSEFEWTSEETETHLRRELGGNFDENLQSAKHAVTKVFHDFPNQKFVQQLGVLVGNHPEGVKLLAHIAKKLK